MADTPTTIADLIKVNDMNLSDIDVSDLLQGAPLIRSLVADTASNGTQHKYLKETDAPVVGFRAANDGRDHDKSTDTLVTIDLKILDATCSADKAVADAYGKGGADAWMEREGRRHLRAAFAFGEKQLLYGTSSADGTGFTGLADATTINHLDDEMVIGGGGTTALTSVFGIRSVDPMTDVTLVTGNNGNLEFGSRYEQLLTGANGKYPGYVQTIYAWLALQIGSRFSVGRIANLDAGANGLDDDKISDLLSLYPADRPCTHLVMNRRSRKQLQQSRTATNPTGMPAPFPTEAFGIPIITTDQISNAETALVAA